MSEDLENTVAGIHNIAIDSDVSNFEQQMRHAIHSYNSKSKANNLRLLRTCVNAIFSLDLSTEQKLNRIARVFFGEKDWGQNMEFSKAGRKPQRVGDYGWPSDSLEEVVELPQLQEKCYRPPYSEGFSTMLVEEMVKVVFKGQEEQRIVVPEELIAFFSCTSGVFSLDFDRRELCPFEAPIKEGVSQARRDHLICDDECLLGLVHGDVGQGTLARKQIHEALEGRNKALKAVVRNYNDRWVDFFEQDVLPCLDVLGGFGFG